MSSGLVILTKYYPDGSFDERNTKWEGMWQVCRGVWKVLSCKTQRKRPTGRPTFRWKSILTCIMKGKVWRDCIEFIRSRNEEGGRIFWI